MFFLIIMKRLEDHFPADKGEQPKRDPMVVSGDHTLNTQAGEPADNGHESLEEAEVKPEPEELSFTHRRKRDAGGKSDGKGIHGKGDGYEDKSEWFHNFAGRDWPDCRSHFERTNKNLLQRLLGSYKIKTDVWSSPEC